MIDDKDSSIKHEVKEGRLWTLESKCPRCGARYYITEYIYKLPLIGSVIISTGRCGECGYTYKDVRMAESRGPQKISILIDSQEDLNILIVRAGTASIYIPDIGVSITPGPASQGFITTVEGILIRVKRVMEMLRGDPDTNMKEWKYKMDLIKKAINGELGFTLVIEDPEGVSKIISEKEEREELYKD
jgi:zinc finger protein